MDASSDLELHLATAAVAKRTTQALLIGARAGMGVDSGFPTFAAQRDSGKPIPLSGKIVLPNFNAVLIRAYERISRRTLPCTSVKRRSIPL